MALSAGRAELPPGRQKKANGSRRLGGRQEAQLQEPPGHALGRSRGGWGTTIHRVGEGHGVIVARHVTAGQRQESKFFEPTLARRLFHRRPGQSRWPRRLAADTGYSYPRIRRWCKHRRVAEVIPTRTNPPRDEGFDKETSKRRNLVERVGGWYKESRSPGTRYEEFAVNSVAMWLRAMIEEALHRLLPSHD
jgi:transposase